MHKKFLMAGIEYIETHLFLELSLEECAKSAGYSLYHFCRVFSAAMGIPVKEYIRKRRVSESVRMINTTSLTLKEIAYYCGFNSQENYIRVFKSAFGISPTEYKKTRYSLLLLEPGVLPAKDLRILDYSLFNEPQIKTIDSFVVTGKKHVTTFENERHFQDVPIFWNQFYAGRLYEYLGYSQDDIRVDHGVSILDENISELYDEDYQRRNLDFEYVTGVRSVEGIKIPDNFSTVTIPDGLYAVFHHMPANEFDLIQNLIDTWKYIDYFWLPNSDYEHAGGIEFNEYHPYRNRLHKTIFIPIQPKVKTS